MFTLRYVVAALVSLNLLAACALPQDRGSAYREAGLPAKTQAHYLLDTGDVVRVSVYGDDELSDLYRIDDRGMIALPLIGPVKARGGTTQAAASRIAATLADGYMRNPEVAVEVAEYRPFFIQGAVAASGQYPYIFDMTVRAAIATAGGYTETANRGSVIIYRREGGQIVHFAADLDSLIAPSDTIVVSERWL